MYQTSVAIYWSDRDQINVAEAVQTERIDRFPAATSVVEDDGYYIYDLGMICLFVCIVNYNISVVYI